MLERAAHAGGVLFLRGEAGIGKSRVGQMLVGMARERGFEPLVGRAWALQRDLAYAPFVAILNELLEGRDHAELTDGLIGLGDLAFGVGLPEAPRLGSAELENTRRCDAVVRLLERLAATRPVLLFIDDLHWADDSSLRLMHWLVSRLHGQRVLVVGAWRSGETPSPALGELARLDADRLDLGPIDREASDALVAEVLEGPAASALLDALWNRCQGNPLFVTTFARALRTEGHVAWTDGVASVPGDLDDFVPGGLRRHIEERLARLGEEERRVLELIACASGGVPMDVVETLLDADGPEHVDRLEESGWLSGDAVVSVQHPLVAQAIYDGIGAGRRRRLHRKLLASTPGRGQLVHGAATETSDIEGLDAIVRAIEDAEHIGGHAELLRLFPRAIERARAARPEQVGALRRRYGELLARNGRLDEAAETLRQVVDACIVVGAQSDAVHALTSLAEVEWERKRFEEADQELHRASDLASALSPGPAHARLACARVVLLERAMRRDELPEAVAVARGSSARHPIPREALRARMAELTVMLGRRRYTDGLALMLDAAEEARRCNAPDLEARALHRAAIAALALGDHASVIEQSEQACRVAAKAGAHALVPMVRLSHPCALVQAGDTQGAIQLADQLIEDGRVSGARIHGLAVCVRSLVGWQAGAAPVADLPPVGDGVSRLTELQNLGHAARELQLGQPEQALQRLLAIIGPRPAQMLRASIPVVTLAMLGEAALASGNLEVVELAASLLEGTGTHPQAIADELRGRAQRDAALLRKARAGYLGLGMPLLANRCRPEAALSPREREVAMLVVEGLTNKAIAERLFISPETVKTHLRRIFDRLEVRSRVALVRELGPPNG